MLTLILCDLVLDGLTYQGVTINVDVRERAHTTTEIVLGDFRYHHWPVALFSSYYRSFDFRVTGSQCPERKRSTLKAYCRGI